MENTELKACKSLMIMIEHIQRSRSTAKHSFTINKTIETTDFIIIVVVEAVIKEIMALSTIVLTIKEIMALLSLDIAYLVKYVAQQVMRQLNSLTA